MANQPLAFAELLAGGILVTAALTGSKLRDVVAGDAGPFKGFDIGGGSAVAAATPASGDPALSGKDGQLLGKPLDRAGVPTQPGILDFARKVAGVFGGPVQLGTGTAHSRTTTSGNESAHWTGRALDLPATGDKLIRLGRAALIAAGMPATQAQAENGGLYNIGRYQIIFATNEGGNHFNHVHIGLRG